MSSERKVGILPAEYLRFQSKKLICSGESVWGEVARRIRWTTGLDSCTAYKQNCGDACGKHKPGMERPVQAGVGVTGKSVHISERRDVE